MLRVINRRVIVFPGSGGDAKIVQLENDNTTLIEALAIAGGITNTGRAKRVKLIRGDLKNPNVYLIDLSTMEGIKNADLVMQANDIIYVEPIPRISQGIVAELAPIVTIITSTILIYSFIKSF
jgi:polysaccharide export outer membrane protein